MTCGSTARHVRKTAITALEIAAQSWVLQPNLSPGSGFLILNPATFRELEGIGSQLGIKAAYSCECRYRDACEPKLGGIVAINLALERQLQAEQECLAAARRSRRDGIRVNSNLAAVTFQCRGHLLVGLEVHHDPFAVLTKC